jgi:small subunit ribosomal protein S6
MQKYELLTILPAKYTESELEAMADKIKGQVTAAGGNVSEVHNLGKRRLAYPIGNVRTGSYVLFFFEAEGAVLGKLNDTLRLSTDLLRHLIVERGPHITKLPAFTEEEARRERRPYEETRRQPTPVSAPIQQAPSKEKISMEELDKKLDQILTEDIL